jgi:hypothetical protein
MIILMVLIIQHHGFLEVTADQAGLVVYVDNDSVGVTPLIKYALPPDDYNVGFFPQDSIEQASWRFKEGNINALWQLARYSEGIAKVRIAPDSLTKVELNFANVKSAPRKAKLKITGCLGGVFLLGMLTTIALQAIF